MRKFLSGLLLALVLPALGAEIKFNFGSFSAVNMPTNFHSALAGGGQPGQWTILLDEAPSAFAPLTPQAPSVSHRAVLAQTSQDMTDEHFPVFVYDGETFKDFRLTTQFKIVSGIVEQMAGVVFRYQNASNFYVLRASALGHNMRFYKMVNGLRSDPIGPQLDITTGAWHTLSVQCQGNQITCWLDDRLAMPPLNDSTFATGQVGFWTKSDAVSYFGDTAINYTPLIPAAQTLVNGIVEKQPRLLGLRIYTLDEKGRPHIIASKIEKEAGQPGTDAEKAAMTDGTVSFARSSGTVLVTLPFHDRNGDPIAAVRVQLKSFFGETQDNAVTRALAVVKEMQTQITSAEDLLK
jgi:hypothetical protein